MRRQRPLLRPRHQQRGDGPGRRARRDHQEDDLRPLRLEGRLGGGLPRGAGAPLAGTRASRTSRLAHHRERSSRRGDSTPSSRGWRQAPVAAASSTPTPSCPRSRRPPPASSATRRPGSASCTPTCSPRPGSRPPTRSARQLAVIHEGAIVQRTAGGSAEALRRRAQGMRAFIARAGSLGRRVPRRGSCCTLVIASRSSRASPRCAHRRAARTTPVRQRGCERHPTRRACPARALSLAQSRHHRHGQVGEDSTDRAALGSPGHLAPEPMLRLAGDR